MRSKQLKTLLCVCLALFLLLSAALGEGYVTLKKGDSGKSVKALKQRMYELGYFNTDSFSDVYNETTVERVRLLQKMNGLEEDGIASAALQELIFSEECVRRDGTGGRAVAVTSDTQEQSASASVQTAPGEEYILKDSKNGKWIYKTDTLSIEITRCTDEKQRLRWYETEIICSPEEPLMTWLSEGGKKPGTKLQQPVEQAKKNHFVLAVSDDYYGFRANDKKNGIPVGIIVRNGTVMNDTTFKAHKGRFPNLETLAVFEDGTMRTFLSDEHTGEEYLQLGATNVFAFGPVLVHNGELGEDIRKKDYYHYREPRQAIGMIQPYHYLIITVDGRLDKQNIRGVYLDWLGQKMLEKGCTEALNLDGGGTAILIFMGERLNRNGSSIRSLNSMIYFGVSDQVN